MASKKAKKSKAKSGKVSKMDEARKIFRSTRNAGERRAEVIAKFQDKLGMSDAMAGTYFQTIRNE